jgi:hypothetical protein
MPIVYIKEKEMHRPIICFWSIYGGKNCFNGKEFNMRDEV